MLARFGLCRALPRDPQSPLASARASQQQFDALAERTGEDFEEGDIAEAIDSGDRPRYEIVDGRIRALYGHSIEIDPGERRRALDFYVERFGVEPEGR